LAYGSKGLAVTAGRPLRALGRQARWSAEGIGL